MNKLISGESQPALVGLVQSVLVAVYCALVGALIFYIADALPRPEFFGIFLMLVLLVFSAAVTGSLVFAYPAYLSLNKKIKESLQVLGFTLLFIFLIIFTAITILLFVV